MKPSVTQAIISGLKEAGIDFISYLPETTLHDVYNGVLADKFFKVVHGTNEGECVAICGGAWLGGRRAAVIMENSGLRVAMEALARLGMGHGIPALMIMPFRGDLGDKDWWAQAHGTTLKPLLEALRIPYRIVEDEADVVPTIKSAWYTMHASKYPVAVIIGGRLCL
jgi:sulfopyruvate decarboxylase subunit alpha